MCRQLLAQTLADLPHNKGCITIVQAAGFCKLGLKKSSSELSLMRTCRDLGASDADAFGVSVKKSSSSESSEAGSLALELLSRSWSCSITTQDLHRKIDLGEEIWQANRVCRSFVDTIQNLMTLNQGRWLLIMSSVSYGRRHAISVNLISTASQLTWAPEVFSDTSLTDNIGTRQDN